MTPYINLSNKNRAVEFIVEYRTTENIKMFFKKYNLISNSDGSIYDCVNKQTFSCIYTWARTLTKNQYA
jgi:hypothetical protein